MDISDLKLKDLLTLKDLLGTHNNASHPYQGKYVVVRSHLSGVHSGYLESYNENTRHLYLKNARRFWSWKAFTLSELSQLGNNPGSKVAILLPEIMIYEVIEIIPCTKEAQNILENYPVHKC